MDPLEELGLLRALERFRARLGPIPDVGKALHFALRETREAFAARAGVVAVRRPGGDVEVRLALPREDGFDRALLGRFIANERPAVPPDQILAPLKRRGRPWGVLALAADADRFAPATGRMLARFAAEVGERIARIDHQRLYEVRSRIDRKLMEQVRPQDLFYQILHGLRSLTRYDHSSALFIGEDGGRSLALVAEQIAWAKGKSRRIGQRLRLDDRVAAEVARETVYAFERDGDEWRDWAGDRATGLAELFDYNRDGDGPREASMLCAPFVSREGVLGVLKIAGRDRGTFALEDADLVAGFVPQAAQAIDNSRRTETLEIRVLAAERKHAMADLARGVSHDVNNALGSVLPLVQQIRADLDSGRADPALVGADLEQIERSLQVCRRIFGGMLSFSRGAARRPSPGSVPRAVENTLAILQDGMERRGARIATELAADLPAVALSQSDLDQVFLNLLSNAREAMPGGGQVTIAARHGDGGVEVAIADTGCGIAADAIGRVEEPFFTTKRDGGGLGLSICRSILWEVDAEMEFESRPGAGTTVRLVLPAAGEGRA